jgi:adenylate cyclase
MAVMAGPWSLDKLAAAAGETEGRLHWFADAGLLHRRPDGDFEPESLHRLRLIQFARRRGFSDGQLAAANAKHGDLLGIFDEFAMTYDAPADLAVAARELGFDEDMIAEMSEVLEWDVEPGTESDVAGMRVLARALELGMPRDALMQIIRAWIDAMDRTADAVVRTFHDYVHERFRAQGLVGEELKKASESVGKPALELVEPAILYFHRRAYRRANREDFLRHLAEETTPPAATLGEEQATVLFVDLASFTPLTATMGDNAAAEVLRRFSVTVRGNATRHRGRILKQIGDAFMLMFAEPADAVQFGLAMQQFVDAEPLFPALHIGAHSGAVLYREGDYVGTTINLAARVASAGAAGQFLITQDLRDAAGTFAEAEFADMPPRRLKGIPDPIRLVEVRHRDADRSKRETDPVCGMLLLPSDIVARTTWGGTTFAFCSEKCKQEFVGDPAHFANAGRD